MFDYARGEKDIPLKKKNLDWYCNKVLEYSHDGFSVEFFLRDHYIRRSAWDKYIKKHEKLQVALQDAKERYKGWAYENLLLKAMEKNNLNPTLFKLIVHQFAGWGNNTTIDDEVDAPPTIIFSKGPPLPKQTLDHLEVQATGELTSKGNGKGGNGDGR